MIKHGLNWLFMAAAIWAMVFIFTPVRWLKKLWLPAFCIGFILTFIINYSAVKILKVWYYPPGLFMVADTPFFISVAWFGEMIAFYFLVLNYPRFKFYILTALSLVSPAAFFLSAVEGHIEIINWSHQEMIFIAIITHSLALAFLRLFFKDPGLAPNEKPLG